ncbi:UNVERIFIED_CONTAM: sporulation and spore germination protein [Acetivibrio alkalicellulosi]
MKKIWIVALCLIVLLLSGCNNSKLSDEVKDLDQDNGQDNSSVNLNESQDQQQEDDDEKIKDIVLYFSDYQAEFMVGEIRSVEIEESIEKTIFEELKKGPESKELYSVIPEGTRLLSVNTEDGICTLDLSQEFISNQPGGTAAESITINAIVNTFTELPDIDKVQLVIEGQIREVLVHQVIDKPIERNERVIKK